AGRAATIAHARRARASGIRLEFPGHLRVCDGSCSLSRFLDRLGIRLQLVLETSDADPQQPRRFRSVSPSALERIKDVTTLDFAQWSDRVERCGVRRNRGKWLVDEEVSLGQHIAVNEDDRLG